MDTVDQAAEWRRLEELYREKSDGELEAIAEQAYDLTDVARDVLQREIASRGVKVTLRESPAPPPEPEPDPETEDFDPAELDLVVTRRVWDAAEAKRYKTILDDAGLPSYLGPENLEKVEDYTGSYERGVELKVCEVDQHLASSAFTNAPHPENEDSSDSVDDKDCEARCPKCRSTEIVFEGLEKDSAKESDFDATYNWSCDACGHTWKDNGVEEEG